MFYHCLTIVQSILNDCARCLVINIHLRENLSENTTDKMDREKQIHRRKWRRKTGISQREWGRERRNEHRRRWIRFLPVNWTPLLSLIHVSELLHRWWDGEGEGREREGEERRGKGRQIHAGESRGRLWPLSHRQTAINKSIGNCGWLENGWGREDGGWKRERPESK